MSDVSPLEESDFPKPYQESMLEAATQMTEGEVLLPSLLLATSSGATSGTEFSVRMKNLGPGNVTLLGSFLEPGEEINLPPCPGIRYDPISYTIPAGTELLVVTLDYPPVQGPR